MKRPAHITMLNGTETSAIDMADRGLAYGDGVFETMRVLGHEIPLLGHHVKRFLKGVAVLGLGDENRLKQDFLNYVDIALVEIKHNACLETCVIKVMVTRGNGGRGYTPPEDAHCHFIVQVFDIPDYPERYAKQGISVLECEYRLGYQPQLAGIKHLNRLDQVLASQELYDEPEGLLLDYDGLVIEGTKSNVLIFKQGQVITPDLSACGVSGVLREELLNPSKKLDLALKVSEVSIEDIVNSDGIAMINSVFGIWFVSRLMLQNGQTTAFEKPANYESIREYLAQNFAY